MHTHSFFTIKQIASLANCSKIVIQKRLERGQLKSFRQGNYGTKRQGLHLIAAADVTKFLNEYRSRKLRTAEATPAQPI
jgi:hypothetical protein